MKKFLSAFLPIFMLACLLASCNGTDRGEPSTKTVNTSEETETETPKWLSEKAYDPNAVTPKRVKPENTESEETSEDPKSAESEKASEEQKPAESEKKTNEIRPEIKEAIDSYEAFIDEYCEFMEEYDSSDLTLMGDYLKLLQKEVDMTQKFEAIEEDELNDAELDYYTKVSLRCSSKLLDCASKMN